MTITDIHRKATRVFMGDGMRFDPVRKAENDYQHRISNPYQECHGCDREYLWETTGVEVYGDGYCPHCAEEEEKIFRCRACGTWRRKESAWPEEIAAKCCDDCMAERIVALEEAMNDALRFTVGECALDYSASLMTRTILRHGLKGNP